jgi:amphi-Trp domain-containing protein
MGDELMEVSDEATMSREEAAARLRDLADQLARHNRIEMVRGGLRFSVRVPDEVRFKFEVEVGDDNEIEVEISW